MKLQDQPVFFLDLQTTGARPENSHILEIAYGNYKELSSVLVEQPGRAEIPRRIQMVTGIKNSDMEEAQPFPMVMKNLLNFLEVNQLKNGICVIHFAQFEKPFLKAAFERFCDEIPFRILCTHEIAKRLYPNLPSRGIKGLAGFFGDNTGDFKRAHHHILATKRIWGKLIEALEEKDITNLIELNDWLIATPKVARTKYEYPLPKEKRLELPDNPGIYRMLNARGEVLYVGKATSLHHRVNSYFRGQKNRDAKKLEMLTQVYDIRVTICNNPLEAALLETDEIKRLNPYYNIALKVGRRSLVFFNHDFSSMSNTFDSEHLIGPFSSLATLEPMLKLIMALKNEIELQSDIFYDELDPKLLSDGFKLFCQRHQMKSEKIKSMRTIMAQGIIWARRLELIEEVIEEVQVEEIEEIDEAEETELTPEDIADKFERHFMRVGMLYLRSKKINALLNSIVFYHESKGPQYEMFIRNGQIGESETKQSQNTWETDAVLTYDRMTVLLTELSRVRSQGGDYSIKLV